MIINHNISALNSTRNLESASMAGSKSFEKLSSGLRINRGADDASGLALSEKMRSQIRGLNQAKRNAQDGISFIQTTEGYLDTSTSAIQRLRELSVQASNGIYSDEDRRLISFEVNQLVDEVDRIASQAQFNGLNMLTGRFAEANGPTPPSSSMWLHVGANMDQRERIFVQTMTAEALGIKQIGTGTVMSVSTADQANRNIGVLDKSLARLNAQRADLGAMQNRLELAVQGVSVASENTQSAESKIRDLDMAKESVNLSKNQILTQASNAMLAQANQRSQMVLQLLQ